MPAIHFDASLVTIGNRAIVRLPADASAKLPSRGQVAVDAIINGQPVRTVLEPDGLRGHWIPLDGELQQALSGDTITVELEPTKHWPEPNVPGDLQAALDAAPDLTEAWHDITPMARWEWVRWVNATKNPDTRKRRVDVSISKLRDGKRRPCCFDLSSCTDPELAKNGKLLGLN